MYSAPQSHRGCRFPDPLHQILCSFFFLLSRSRTIRATGPQYFTHYESEVNVTQSCLTLCNPTNYTVHGIFQARILELVAFHFSRGSSQPGNRTRDSCTAGGFSSSRATREALQYIKRRHESGRETQTTQSDFTRQLTQEGRPACH